MSDQTGAGPADEGPPAGAAGADETAGEAVGSVAEEAIKLLGALSTWAADQGTETGEGLAGLARHAADSARGLGDHLEENLATGAPECTYCPICRTVHVVRQVSPEVRTHLVSAASSLLQAASGILAAAATPPSSTRSDRVEHIDLDPEDDNPWPEES